MSRSIKLVIDNDNDLDDELQIPEHGFDNEGAVSHAKNLKDPGKYILQSCHDNDNYTNEVSFNFIILKKLLRHMSVRVRLVYHS